MFLFIIVRSTFNLNFRLTQHLTMMRIRQTKLFSAEKTCTVSLDKMIVPVATLVERSRETDHKLSISPRDYNAIAGGKRSYFPLSADQRQYQSDETC
jgi:hypothetical protein